MNQHTDSLEIHLHYFIRNTSSLYSIDHDTYILIHLHLARCLEIDFFFYFIDFFLDE